MRDQTCGPRTRDGATMPLQGVDVRGRVRGLALELTVEQRFRNASPANAEVVYTFPLPVDAVLLDLDVTIGGRHLVAAVVEKRAAERDYEQALESGDTAIMLERAGDGMCTLNLGNLMAGESATVRYRTSHLLRFTHGSVRLAIPATIAPRYGDPHAAGLEAHQVPHPDLAAAYPLTLALDVEGALARGRVSSPSHAIAVTPGEAGLHVELARGAWLDRDFVLSFDGLEAATVTSVARDGDAFVALASFCAPAASDAKPIALKVLVDCSGSMAGDSIDAARRALHRIFESLEPGDRVSLTRFGSTVEPMTKGMLACDASGVRTLAGCVRVIDANLGGTEMERALRHVFAIGGSAGAADVLLLTDGEVWQAEGLVEAARRASQRVFAVGIGAAPAEGVLRGLANATGGACEFVAPGEDAEAAILRMFARLRAPRIGRAEIAWPATPTWTIPLPMGLFGGETVHALAGFAVAPQGEARLTLHANDGAAPVEVAAALPAAVNDDRVLARTAASRRIGFADAGEKLALALEYRLLTDRTNLLVVHERAAGEKAQALPELMQVRPMLAAGWGGVGSVVQSRSMHPGMVKDMYSVDSIAFDADAPVRVHRDALDFDDSGEAWMRAFALRYAQAALPATPLASLVGMGVPPSVVVELRHLVDAGHAEADVLRAFVEAVVRWLDAHGGPPSIPRHALRSMRHPFARERDHERLRDLLQGCVDRWALEQQSDAY